MDLLSYIARLVGPGSFAPPDAAPRGSQGPAMPGRRRKFKRASRGNLGRRKAATWKAGGARAHR